jgi:hypothetical protein
MFATDSNIRRRTPVPVPVVMWRDIFALVDQGRSEVDDYPILERMVCEQADNHPAGLACLVIIPSTATPPSDEVRRAINDVLTRLGPRLRCLCWLVEGSGFRAATVRAALAGLRILSRPPYPTHVAGDLRGALRWVMPQLRDGSARLDDIPVAMDAINQGRGSVMPGVRDS